MKHLLNIKIDVQFPASLEISRDEVDDRRAARKLRTDKPRRFAKGAPTVVSPMPTARSEENTSAPAALKVVLASMSFSVDPGKLCFW
jgi:hypothetical protein